MIFMMDAASVHCNSASSEMPRHSNTHDQEGDREYFIKTLIAIWFSMIFVILSGPLESNFSLHPAYTIPEVATDDITLIIGTR